MKAKYLFYSLALASAFTACTQDEMFDAPALDSNEVANRPVAGIVTFVNDEADSRYDRQNAWFEDGDKLGLYLMDKFNGEGEEFNANETPWKYQSCWWTMYEMVDYINTSYGYVYNKETKEWINRASQLIEGNYIALFPQNERATNRQNLWHAIDANVDLVDHTSKPRFYVNRDNQFFVGYEQILRDQKAGEGTGELRADITMKAIMTYQVIELVNESNFNFKPKKVVFKAHGGDLLPNVAYINPIAPAVELTSDGYTAPWWAFVNGKATDFMKADPLTDGCGEVLAYGNYDRKTFSQAAARGLVEYGYTTDGIPYGMTEAEAVPAYEYVFNFPADADIIYGGIEAAENGGVTATKSTISIALPMFEGWENMEMVVYGEMQTSDDTYRPGILRKRIDVDNGKFNYTLRAWNESMGTAYPTSTVAFDENYFYQQEEIRVSTTEDLVNLLTARLSDTYTGENLIEFDVQVYGNGVEITDEVVKVITDYEDTNKNVDVKVEFKNGDQVATPLIFKTNAIDMFEYVGMNAVVEVPQTITGEVKGINELRNFSTITVAGVEDSYNATLTTVKIVNEANATISTSYAVVNAEQGIENHGTVDLNATTVYGNILNEAVMNAGNGSDVNGIVTNDNNCLNCGDGKATLTINGLEVDFLNNADDVVVNGGLTIVNNFTNNGSTVNNGEINGDGQIDNYSVIDNYGKITIKGILFNHATGKINNGDIEADKAGVRTDGLVKNGGEINAYKGTIKSLLNLVQESDGEKLNGVLRVWAAEGNEVQSEIGSCGTIIFEDVNAQHIATEGSDLRVYRTAENKLSSELEVSLEYTDASQIWTSFDIHFDVHFGCSTPNNSDLDKIKVTGNATFTADYSEDGVANMPGAVFANLEVLKNCQLDLEDNSWFWFNSMSGEGEIHVATGTEFYYGVKKTTMNGKVSYNVDGDKYVKGHKVIKL